MAINWEFTDVHQQYAMTLRNSAITYLENARNPQADASVTLTKATLTRVTSGQQTLRDAALSGAIHVEGNPGAVVSLFRMLDSFAPEFDIVTPAQLPGRAN